MTSVISVFRLVVGIHGNRTIGEFSVFVSGLGWYVVLSLIGLVLPFGNIQIADPSVGFIVVTVVLGGFAFMGLATNILYRFIPGVGVEVQEAIKRGDYLKLYFSKYFTWILSSLFFAGVFYLLGDLIPRVM
jgi:hypothetical protein